MATTDSRPAIRSATPGDAEALLAIYRPFVEATTVSFETAVPAPAEFAARIARALTHWSWLVAEADGGILGYAYGSSHRERAAYCWSVETSVYLAPAAQGRGLGRALYRVLFDTLAARGYCNAFAGIALPNDASVRLHAAAGFEPIGVFRRVGRKFGTWCDVAWCQRRLRDESPDAS